MSGDRSIGMGPGPIPWASMVFYAQHHELDDDETGNLLFFLRKMDTAFLRYHEKKLERK